MSKHSLISIIEEQSTYQPNVNAVLSLTNPPCTYQDLFRQVHQTVRFMNSMNIHRNDPVAIVLPNGPTMATAFFSIASGAASAPLNPAYTASEFEFYLTDLKAKALVIEENSKSPAINVAQKLGLTIIYISSLPNAPAGMFKLKSEGTSEQTKAPTYSISSDIALILHTSGTTQRPKQVPLTQNNIITSAGNIAKTLQLTQNDICLNVMPLFHIHGLMAAVMASFYSGACIACSPGFYSPKFFTWMDKFKPTWYTAVPTIHQSVLARSDANSDIIKKSRLRFIRSSSSSLSPLVMEELENTFSVPVIEAYGMTEASHQMSSNPLPPGIRKPGSVGLPTGPEMAIMHEITPEILPNKSVGEIVIRGQNVTLGYLNNPEANEKAFTSGWFRTGDQGYLDEDGYLFISGRLKEIINRGGEKISPREIDEALLDHPAVLQAVAFSIPDKALGEDIAATVVLRDSGVDDKELKRHLANTLAPHKIPQQILILDEIPKGATGKIQRIGLAQQLGFTAVSTSGPKNQPDTYQAPQTNVEKRLCIIWQKNLDLPQVGIHDQYRNLGGDSMLATLLHQEIEMVFKLEIPLYEIFGTPTIAEQALLIESYLSNTDQ